jgi:hypothetical protein
LRAGSQVLRAYCKSKSSVKKLAMREAYMIGEERRERVYISKSFEEGEKEKSYMCGRFSVV